MEGPGMLAIVVAMALCGAPKGAAPPPLPKAPAKEPTIVLQLEVVDGAIDAAERVRVEDSITALLNRHKRIEAVTQREVKRLVDLEAARAASGCDDEGCAAEIGAALGARWLVGGGVERVGAQMMLSMSLFGAASAEGKTRAKAKRARSVDIKGRLPLTHLAG